MFYVAGVFGHERRPLSGTLYPGEAQEALCGLDNVTVGSILTGASIKWVKFEFFLANHPFNFKPNQSPNKAAAHRERESQRLQHFSPPSLFYLTSAWRLALPCVQCTI